MIWWICVGLVAGWATGKILKGSGYGRFGGKAGIEAFTELRWITIAGEPGHYPI